MQLYLQKRGSNAAPSDLPVPALLLQWEGVLLEMPTSLQAQTPSPFFLCHSMPIAEVMYAPSLVLL